MKTNPYKSIKNIQIHTNLVVSNISFWFFTPIYGEIDPLCLNHQFLELNPRFKHFSWRCGRDPVHEHWKGTFARSQAGHKDISLEDLDLWIGRWLGPKMRTYDGVPDLRKYRQVSANLLPRGKRYFLFCRIRVFIFFILAAWLSLHLHKYCIMSISLCF